MIKRNWQKETDRIIESLNGKKVRLLLHACCAPCASASLEYLTKYFDITLFFYNPNISEKAEFDKRLRELEKFVAAAPFAKGIEIIAPEYYHNVFLEKAAGLEDAREGGERCKGCFELRLLKTAELAKEKKFDYFATTLTISPLKNAEMINTIGLKFSEEIGTAYLPTDLKKAERYKRSIELSKEYALYRQNFCGCEFSKPQITR